LKKSSLLFALMQKVTKKSSQFDIKSLYRKFSFTNWHWENHSLWKLIVETAACNGKLLQRWIFRMERLL
jgi:hypothetical protein